MKAITVFPGMKDSARVADLPRPRLEEVPEGRGVLVKVLRVGLDGTDKEISAGEYGIAPPGSDYLVIGHESLGVVEQVGDHVTELAPGDFVVAMVRHPGEGLYDAIGLPDMTTADTYYEHGISLLHGFLAEYYVDSPEYLIKVPPSLREVAVLLEPTSIVEKGLTQVLEIQRRLKIWQPRRAAVLGAGSIGLLATALLRMRDVEVVAFAKEKAPYLRSELAEAVGARYQSTEERTLSQLAEQEGRFDLIFEASGFSPLAFEAMTALAKNGVLVLTSVTSGQREVSVPTDAINLEFVLGNKVMVGTVNANRDAFELGVRDLAMAESRFPGWLSRLITRRVEGLDQCPSEVRLLDTGPAAIKTCVDVAPMA
jgi:threonine dehydrogenase-like Zn-dependent dehydrogenase